MAAPEPLSDAGTLYRLFIESVQDYALYVLDRNGFVRSWNPGAQRLKGYTADEIIGQHFSRFYTPEDVAEKRPEHNLDVARREGHVEDEGWRVRKDGSRFWASVVITALRDQDGTLVGFAKITRDLTAHRHAEEQARQIAAETAARATAEAKNRELQTLNQQLQDQAVELESQTEEAQSLAEELEQANAQLEETLAEAEEAREDALSARREAEHANRAKTDFLAVMSHELRTPLNAIAGYAELLRLGLQGTLTPGQDEYVARIQRSQSHLLSLINDVLNFAKLESTQVEYILEDVRMHNALQEMEELLLPQVRLAGLSFQYESCANNLCARADPEKLRQILLNLLSNAIKFTQRGGRIILSCRAAGPAIEVVVRDSGIGIPAEKHDVIFEPFVQLSHGMTDRQPGTGLGLAISRDLARGMGGDLRVESQPGDGSSFILSLPAATQTARMPKAREVERPGKGKG